MLILIFSRKAIFFILLIGCWGAINYTYIEIAKVDHAEFFLNISPFPSYKNKFVDSQQQMILSHLNQTNSLKPSFIVG